MMCTWYNVTQHREVFVVESRRVLFIPTWYVCIHMYVLLKLEVYCLRLVYLVFAA